MNCGLKWSGKKKQSASFANSWDKEGLKLDFCEKQFIVETIHEGLPLWAGFFSFCRNGLFAKSDVLKSGNMRIF